MAPLSETDLVALYRDLHAHPELAFQEERTAGIVAARLASWGYDVTTGVGGTGVVGVLDNGPGATALLRADLDGLPVLEQTGAEYASAPCRVMHACGHDVHVTCLLGAAARLATERDAYAGRVLLVFQPAEELGAGARAMVEDGLFERFGSPTWCSASMSRPSLPGLLGLHAGPAMAASDSLTITLHGSGGHGSRPETTVDPVVMAAATVLRLQTIVSRETAATETAVVTVGMMRAGSAGNVIPDRAELRVNVRSFEPAVRERTLAAISRIVNAEAAGVRRSALAGHRAHRPLPGGGQRPRGHRANPRAFSQWLGEGLVIDPGVVTGSEDVGSSPRRPGAVRLLVARRCGGDAFAGAATEEELREVVRSDPEQPLAGVPPGGHADADYRRRGTGSSCSRVVAAASCAGWVICG